MLRVAVLGRPVGQTGGLRRTVGDEVAPVAHHLIGQDLLRGIQRRRTPHAEQVPQFQGMAGADRERRVPQKIGLRRLPIIELVGVDRRVTAQRASESVCGAGKHTVGGRGRVSERDVPAVVIGRIVRQHRGAAVGAEDVGKHIWILAGADSPVQLGGPQGGEERELVVVDADQYRNPRRLVGGERRHRIVRQRRGSGHRAGERIGVAEEVVPGWTFEPGRRESTQTPCGGGGIATAGGDRVVGALPLPEGHLGLRLARRTLDDRCPEQSRRAGRDQMVADRHAARGFAGDRHLLRVAAECGDVVTNPAQCGLLIGQSVIAYRAGRAERRMSQEAQGHPAGS